MSNEGTTEGDFVIELARTDGPRTTIASTRSLEKSI